MVSVTLKQLRYFEALSRQAHFGRAAEVSAISQPALSMQIRELEAALGLKLFERGARSVALTRAGEDLAPRIRAILRGVDELGESARAAQEDVQGTLRLGVIPTIAPYFLPRVIGGLSQSHPGLDIHVRETQTARLVDELTDGRLDAAIVALPVSEPALEEVPLFTEEFVLVRPRADASSPVPDGEDLQRMRLLLLEEGHCFRDQALAFCKLTTASPREGLEGSSLSTLVQLVAAGMGVTLVPQMAVTIERASAAVSVARFRPPRPVRQVGMIWRRRNPLAERLRDMARIVRDAVPPDWIAADPR